MGNVGSRLAEVFFITGDVQTSSIAIFILGMLSFSIICFIVGLLYHKPPVASKKKRKKSNGSFLPRIRWNGQSANSGTQRLRNTQRMRQSPEHRSRGGQGASNTVIVSCHVIRRFASSVLCVTCSQLPAKKACRYSRCGACCKTNKQSICVAHGTGVTAALGLIESACEEKPMELDLSYMNLKQCPSRIGYVGSQLASLNLSNNRLVKLPEELGLLRGLEELFLQYNCLEQLPECIGNFPRLQELDCKNNRLKELPVSLGNLSYLSVLNVTNNMLSCLPSAIGQLTKLEELCAHSNQLTELPEEICNLVHLSALYVGENRMTELPTNIGHLVMLCEMDFSSCEITRLPDSLSRCTSLNKVWLSNNKLVTLPDQIGRLHQLKELHLRNNKIKYFPASLSYLQLYTFSANQNPLLNEWDVKTIHDLYTHTPTAEVPSLLELTARTVAKHKVSWNSEELPTVLQDLLSKQRKCSSCEGSFFQHYRSEVVFANIGIFHRVPLYQQICSPHMNYHCQAIEVI